MRTGIPSKGLTPAIHNLMGFVKTGKKHPNYRNLKKVIRGLRRRRNWLMRTGQWPIIRKKKDLRALGIMGESFEFDAVNIDLNDGCGIHNDAPDVQAALDKAAENWKKAHE